MPANKRAIQLEELDQIFEARNPVKASTKKTAIVVDAENNVKF
jgi:hypothetical protein